MASDVRWKVVTVPGHDLEARLQQLTEEQYEIVNIDRSGTHWTIIARISDREVKMGNPIGFRASEK
jgi:hypothetical protein